MKRRHFIAGLGTMAAVSVHWPFPQTLLALADEVVE